MKTPAKKPSASSPVSSSPSAEKTKASGTGTKPAPPPAPSSDPKSRAAREKAAPKEKALPVPLDPGKTPPDEFWNDYFSKNQPTAAAVCEAALKLHRAKKYPLVVALIEAALIQGQSQPWMYTVLALTMEQTGRPKDEIERVLLSGVDFSAVNIPNLLYSAAFLTRFGVKDRALELYRQASTMDPTRPEPYILGLKLARGLQDPGAVKWAAVGTLSRVWNDDYVNLHREADEAVQEMDTKLRKDGQAALADELAAAVADAKQRDLYVELSWSGNADLDLSVEEPAGSICSFMQRRTVGGGILLHDGYGPDQKNTFEKYLCPQGFAGDYRIKVRHVWGDVVGKRAVLKIVRYQGSSKEMSETLSLPFEGKEKVVRVTLHKGRLKAPSAVPKDEEVSLRRAPRKANWQTVGRRAAPERQVGAAANIAEGRRGARVGGAGVGYQPVITVLSEGVTNSAMAVISADRRYVRLTLSPVFSAITDVFTFSYVNSGNTAAGGGGNTPAGRR